MRYCSIDIETTGLNPATCQIIEFAAVVDDLRDQKPIDKLPRFQTYIHHPIYQGEPYALAMHAEIFKKLAKFPDDDIIEADSLFAAFYNFLTGPGGSSSTIVVAGKNFASFDQKFLEKLPNKFVKFRHRILDPAMLFTDPMLDDAPPSSALCLERAGLEGEVAHTALEDALMVVKLLRKGFSRRPTLGL